MRIVETMVTYREGLWCIEGLSRFCLFHNCDGWQYVAFPEYADYCETCMVKVPDNIKALMSLLNL